MKRFIIPIFFAFTLAFQAGFAMEGSSFSNRSEGSLFDFNDNSTKEFIIDLNEETKDTSFFAPIAHQDHNNGYVINDFSELNNINPGLIINPSADTLVCTPLSHETNWNQINANQNQFLNTQSSHTAALDIACPQCPGRFPTQRNLSGHMASHKNIANPQDAAVAADPHGMFKIIKVVDPTKKKRESLRHQCLHPLKDGTVCQYLAIGYTKFIRHSAKHRKSK